MALMSVNPSSSIFRKQTNIFISMSFLHRAVEADKLDTVMMLLSTENGETAMSKCDKKGRNVFHYAVKHAEIIHFLVINVKVGF